MGSLQQKNHEVKNQDFKCVMLKADLRQFKITFEQKNKQFVCFFYNETHR